MNESHQVSGSDGDRVDQISRDFDFEDDAIVGGQNWQECIQAHLTTSTQVKVKGSFKMHSEEQREAFV